MVKEIMKENIIEIIMSSLINRPLWDGLYKMTYYRYIVKIRPTQLLLKLEGKYVDTFNSIQFNSI